MQISKNTILLVSALGIFSGCSDDVADLQTQSEAIEKVLQKAPEKAFTNFEDLSDKNVSRGFDLRPEGLSATVMRLGNVLLDADGTLAIFPTPSYSKGKLSSQTWRYQTRFEGIGRNSIIPLPLIGTTLSGKRIVMNHDILNVEYEHRTVGLEQFVTLKNRPLGEGKLQVAFSLPDEFDYELSSKKDSVTVSFEEKVVFEWSNLFTHDAKGRALTSSIRLEDGKMIYEVDDTNATYPIVIDPLANVPNTTLTATGPGAEFGISVNSAGDVNNDGFDDLIVGEFEFSNGNNEEGRALIFPGSAAGIGATAIWTVEGGADFAKFGAEVLGIGDINNDNFDDFAVGAELDGGFQGRAYVYLGGATPSTTPIFTAIAPSPSIEAFGGNITSGDYNCDGLTDLAVSAHLYDGGGPGNDWGRVLVYDGDISVQRFNSVPTQFTGPASETFFGGALESGNFNDDTAGGNACDDLVIGQPHLTLGGAARRGGVSIFFGGLAGLTTSGWSAEGTSKENRFGVGLGVGDTNNDGVDDLAVGGYHAEAGGKGTAALYLGSAGVMSTTPVWAVEGEADANFGRDIDILDADNNSFGDVLVTAEKHVFAGSLTEGAVFIYFNGNGTPALTPLWSETEGANADSNYGWNGGSAGDVNGDGIEDVFVGAFGTDGLNAPLGHAYVYHGVRTCTIGGVFLGEGDVDPANPCQSCNPNVDATAFTAAANGTSCDDNDACTISDVCQAGVCGGSVETCNDNDPCTDESCDSVTGCLFLTAPVNGDACADDGEACTNDVCLNGVCDHPVAPNSCFINNTCYPAGAPELNSPCMQCNPAVSTTSFTPAALGDSCDDGLFCTTGDTCDVAGQCQGGARDCSIADGPCIATTICNENTDQCLPGSLEPLGSSCNSGDLCNAGTCGVGGICNATNAVDCTAFNGPCATGVCDPQDGSCSAALAQDGTVCDDGVTCTSESCQAGNCVATVNPGSCNIANMCIMDGTTELGNVCRVCDSTQSRSDYSNVPVGTTCLPVACNNTQTGTQDSDCDGNGGCILQPTNDCGAYLCDANLDSCFTQCLTQTQCETGANCTSDGVTPGICVTDKPTAVVDGPTEGICSEKVTLDANNSTDPNALALTYLWTQLEGPDVLANVATTNATLVVTLPDVMEVPTLFRFQVVASNGAFDSDPQEWIVSGIECPTVMEPGPDMGTDTSIDVSNDTSSDMGPDLTTDTGADTSDSDLTGEVHGSGCLCSSTAKYPTDASWLLLLAFFGFRKRKKK